MNQLLSLDKRITAFVELGKVLGRAANSLLSEDSVFIEKHPGFFRSLQEASLYNPWFTPANIAFALNTWQKTLTKEGLDLWLAEYKNRIQPIIPKRVVVIMAGNIPLVGFHDFLCSVLA